MCGRYIIPARFEKSFEAFADILPSVRADWSQVEENYDFSPGQYGPILRLQQGCLAMDLARWGLIPSWAKDSKWKFPTHNARAETVAEKPSFRAAFRARRCLVPAGGYYEWRDDPGGKTRFFIRPREGSLFLFAGLWETWQPVEGDALTSYSIITTSPNPYLARIHDRMPLILDGEQARHWLDPGVDPTRLVSVLREMLIPCPDERVEAWPVVKQPAGYHGPGLTERAPSEPPADHPGQTDSPKDNLFS